MDYAIAANATLPSTLLGRESIVHIDLRPKAGIGKGAEECMKIGAQLRAVAPAEVEVRHVDHNVCVQHQTSWITGGPMLPTNNLVSADLVVGHRALRAALLAVEDRERGSIRQRARSLPGDSREPDRTGSP
jgi:hypothetical protein